MLFTDYLKKCLEDEEFRKEWESLDESLKNNYSVEDNPYGLCAKINNNESLKEEYKTLPESAQYDFEDRLLKIGFILDDETSMYGSKREIGRPGHANIHYQIITKDTYDEEGWNNKLDDLYDVINLFEEDYDCSITFSAGLGIDGRITAGIDIRDYWEADEGTDQIAPSRGQHLTFKDGELEDTENNKYVVDDITSHMDLSKDDIVNAIAGKKNKKVEESWDDKVELEYTNLPITYHKFRPSSNWREPDEYEDIPTKIDYTYKPYKDDVEYEIVDILLSTDSDFDDYTEEELNNYVEEHFDELLDKYYDAIVDRFKKYAIEDAEQNYELD